MTYTGPQKITGASLAYWYQDNYPGDKFEANVGVLHTTEGATLPSYSGGAVAPNVTGVPDFANKKIKWYQHFDVDVSSRALVNQSGGVQTNTLNAFQVELVGTCDPATHKKWTDAGVQHIFWPEAPDWALNGVAILVKWLHDNHGMRIESTVTWKAYPGSYGASNGVRLSGAAWVDYYGWLGHEHVPENLHGDPGNINWKRIEELAKGTATPGGETNVALTAADVKTLAKTDNVFKSPTYLDPNETNKAWTLESYLYETYKVAAGAGSIATLARTDVQAVKKAVDALSAKVDGLATGGVDLDALAEKVADLLAARLAS